MERTSRVMERLQRTAPVAGDLGGVLFFVYWTTRARGIELPPLLAVLIDLATMFLVGASVLGYQLAQGLAAHAWLGWAAAAAIGLGFGGSLALLCAGLVLFGLSIVRCGVHRRLPGQLLMFGGGVLLVAQEFAPGFGRADSGFSVAWGALMGLALVGVAGAMADLDVVHQGQGQQVTR